MIEKIPISERVFLTGLFFAGTLFIPGILDLTMVPRFIALAIVLLMVVFRIYKLGGNLIFKIDFIVLFYLLFALYSTLTIFWAKSKSESIFDACKIWLSILSFLAMYYFLRIKGTKFESGLHKIAIATCLLTACVAFFQLFELPDLKKESMYLVTGLNSHKNLLTSFLFLMLPFVIGGIKNLKSHWKVLSVLALICSLILIVLLRTKAVWLGLSAGALFFIIALLIKKKNISTGLKPFIVSAFILISINLFFIFLLPSLIKKYSSGLTDNNSISQKSLMAGLDQERLVVWDKTYTIMAKQPLFGYGTGNWQIYFPDATLTGLWRVEDLNVTFQRPHNDFLWLLSETGFVGFNLFMGFLILLIVSGLYYLKSLPTTALIYSSTIIGFYIISFFDFPRERTEHLVWIHCLLALLYFQIKSTGGVSIAFTVNIRKRFFLLPLSLLVFILFVGLLRFKGEYFTRLLYDYKNSGRLSDVVKSGHSALSFAYTLDPTSVPVQWYTGNAQAALGNYDVAQSDFISAYNFNPYNRNVLNDLASAYVFNQQTQQAIPLYEEAARISPRFDEPKLNLAAIYIGRQDFVTANQWLKSLLHDSKRRSDYQTLVDIELQSQKFNSSTK